MLARSAQQPLQFSARTAASATQRQPSAQNVMQHLFLPASPRLLALVVPVQQINNIRRILFPAPLAQYVILMQALTFMVYAR
jgi:hypothetical protein